MQGTDKATNSENRSLPINVWYISLSAFFADFGYQAVIVGFPLFIVLILRAPVYYYGIAEALNYGVGSVFAYYGGRLASKYGSKKIAILGNSLIPVLSFTGFAGTVYEAVAIFAGGWWARNFRSPARRALMSESVSEGNRSRAYGLLHGLDVGGGILATLVFISLISLGYPFRTVFIVTIIPIVISTFMLIKVKPPVTQKVKSDVTKKRHSGFFGGVIISSALFGFGYYSMGFLVLTVALVTSDILLGALTYTIFLSVSASVGFLMSRVKMKREALPLGLLGYILAGLGALLYAISIIEKFPTASFYLSTVVIGLGTGFTEVFEPTIISKVSENVGRGMGWLTASRSAGLFAANIIMGFLYFVDPAYSYIYAFSVALVAGLTVIFTGRTYDRELVAEIQK
jgi:MFS family permease